MRLKGRSILLILLILILCSAVLPLNILQAQNNTITLQVAVPSLYKDALSDKLLSQFEQANPGVKVKVVANDTDVSPAAAGLDAHFEALQKYASSADVLFVDSTRITVEGTLAGYFLDLTPLVNEDKTLNIDDFFPPLWQSFQWNRSVWALPFATGIDVMTYQPSAFDKIGLAYPDEKWTLDDLVNAVKKLTQKDTSGAVTTHGIDLLGNLATASLFRSLVSQGLYDGSTLPNNPQIDTPELENLLDTWVPLQRDDLVGSDLNKAPLSVSPAATILIQLDPTQKRVGLLLPGGKAGLNIQGFAVSKGTQYETQAYALAAFLTTRPELLTANFGLTPARKSLVGAQGDSPQGFRINTTPEYDALIKRAVANGIPLSELRHADYLALALKQMTLTKADAKTTLQNMENQALANLKTSLDKKDKNVLVVATPVPALAANSSKITLHFGVTSFVRPLPFQDKWDKLAQDFAASDPQVGQVSIETGLDQLGAAAGKYDCFYLPFNGVPNAQLNTILNLDPFIGNDTTFDKSDVVGNVVSQLQRDNKIWALPVAIEPSILKYDSAQFAKAGVPNPGASWTVSAFNDAVKALKTDPKDAPPFIPANQGGTHLLVLIAAYGGLPLDYRTDPPTVNFTDPNTVTAIRQVLDLAKNGYIKYEALGSLNFGFGGPNHTGTIYTDTLTVFSFRPNTTDPTTDKNSSYKPTNYPRGTQYSAVSYGVDTAYISTKSQNPDACYRWISLIARHPELFSAMPARRSLINDSAQSAAQGPDVTALYNQIDKILQDPTTLSIPSQFTGTASPTAFLLQFWLYKAFDNYILKNGDLEASLKEAENNSKAFQDCATTLPPLDTTSQDSARTYIKAFGECATKVDPSLKPIFALIGG